MNSRPRIHPSRKGALGYRAVPRALDLGDDAAGPRRAWLHGLSAQTVRCTRGLIDTADVRPDWKEQPPQESLTGKVSRWVVRRLAAPIVASFPSVVPKS
jgi:hypothetical protein